MKIQLLNNQELIIKARNEKDFQDALVVANKIAEHDEDTDVCSYCEFEMWVHITAVGSQGNAEWLNTLYTKYKAEL